MESKRYIGKVFKHFRILEPLGQGGMGLVFKALNTHLNKIVAIKMIAPGLALNDKLLNRFKTEALALARLENPHIVRILDLLEDEGQWFIVMEYIEGETLSARLKGKRPIQLSEVFDITLQILSALQHAHSAGIIHRDIKPSNILITKDDIIKVTDFGLAKIQANSLVHTQQSAVGGTLYYMSPEQVRSLRETDHRTDIYSLGITLYQMVTGRIPFDPHQTDFDIREAIVRKEFAKPSTFNPYLPPEIDALVMKALAKNPDDRFQSAVEMVQEMERIRDKVDNKMDQNIPIIDSEVNEEINFEDYPFRVKEDLSEQSESKPSKAGTSQNQNYHNANLSSGNKSHFPSRLPEWPSSYIARFAQRTKGKKIYRLFALLLFIILIAVIIFLQKSTFHKPSSAVLKIYSEPSVASIYLNRQMVGKTPLDSLQIKPGTIQLQLRKNGFFNFDTTVAIQSNVTMILRLALVKKPLIKKIKPESTTQAKMTPVFNPASKMINITFNSTPPNANIFINHKFAGTTPLKSAFPQGKKLTVRLQKAGYFTSTDTFLVLSKGKHRFLVVLKPKPVTLKIEVHPTPASVFIDGIKKGLLNKPLTPFSLKPGHHSVKIIRDGFSPIEKSVNLAVNTSGTLKFLLHPLNGKLNILVLPWGNIYIDGKLKKQETNVKESLTLSAGKHVVRVIHPTFGSCEEIVTIKPKSTLDLVYDFTKPVSVKVLAFDENGKAQNAQILVDDKPILQYTPGIVFIPIGKHEISVQKNGFSVKDGSKSIMFTPSFKSTLKFILKK